MKPTSSLALQRAINTHAIRMGLPTIDVDGEVGPITIAGGRRVAWLMGVKLGPGRRRLSARARKVILGTPRTPVELARAVARRKLRPLRLKAWDQMQHLIDLKVTESGGNNHGPWVEKIIRENGGTVGEAWCGDTVAACYIWAGGGKLVNRMWASVAWLQANLAKTTRPRRGNVVTYLFSHTGMFKRWAPEIGPGYFYAGEGNTGNTGAVSDSQTGGDGVKLKIRHISQVSGFHSVRP